MSIEILTEDETPWIHDFVEYDEDRNVKSIIPCTCEESCGSACKGSCGCRACLLHYSDFLSNE